MLISIVIPAYNAERFIEILLKNLANQVESEHKMNNDCEIIVVNDGSKDRTKEIVEKFEKKFPYIRLINQDNKGESGARNTGIENANGDYVYFLDCDDSLADGSLYHFIKIMKQNPDLDLYCFSYISTENGRILKKYLNKKIDKKTFLQIDFLKNYLLKKLPIHVCSCVVSRKLIENCFLRFSVGLRIGADIEWLLNVGSVIKSAYYSNRICYVYQIRNDSIMQGYKTYSITQYHSFEVRRDICLNDFYQQEDLKKYSNFWIQNQLLSNIFYYLHSNVSDKTITKNLINDCNLLKRKSKNGAFKNSLAIKIAKVLPLKFILKFAKEK